MRGTKRLLRTAVSLLLCAWLFAGWPVLWEHPRIPPAMSTALAATDTITTSGNWTVPAGVTSATVEVWGGGGGGGANSNGEGGGGGGAYARSVLSLTEGDSWTVTVGNGGNANQDGGDTSFVRGGTSVIADAGKRPTTSSGRGSGAGGTTSGSTGTFKTAGGGGGVSSGSNAGGGGGGSSAGTAGNGNNGSNNSGNTGGAGGAAPTGGHAGGNGGNRLAAGQQGPDANGGAGGGGGGQSANAGAGRPGLVKVTYTVISVSVSDGSVDYGTLTDNSNQSTASGGLNDTQVATNNGGAAEDFNIKGQSSAAWTLAGSAGADQYVHQFCTAGSGSPDPCDASPTWTALTTSYQSLATNISVSGTKRFDLRLLTPSSSSTGSQQAVDITIQAVEH